MSLHTNPNGLVESVVCTMPSRQSKKGAFTTINKEW